MNKVKLIMAVMALAGLLAMCAIGYAIAIRNVLGALIGIVAVIAIFGVAFTLKSKFRKQGLL